MSYPTSVPASVSKVLDAFYSLSDLSPKDDPKVRLPLPVEGSRRPKLMLLLLSRLQTHEKYAALFVSDKPSCIAPQGIL